MIAIWELPLLFVVAGRRTQVATWGRQAVCAVNAARLDGSQLCFRPSQVAVNQQTHWPPTWPTCSSRSGCDADWCGSAADKLSGGIGTLAIAFQIRRWSSQTLMSIVSHYNWWSVVFGRAPERERHSQRLLRDQLNDLWHPKRNGNSWRVAFLVRVVSWANGKCQPQSITNDAIVYPTFDVAGQTVWHFSN